MYHVYGNKKIFLIKLFKVLIEKTIKSFLSLFYKFNDNQKIIISTAVYAPWIENKEFSLLFKDIKNLTLLDEARAYTLWYLSKSIQNNEGDILDIGTMKGGAGILLSRSNKNKNSTTYFIDTFDGFAISSGEHLEKKIFNYQNLDELKKNIQSKKIKKYKIVKTRFPKNFKIRKKIKFCHLDINIYKDTLNSFKFVDKFMTKGGIIVFDDYGIFKVDEILKVIKYIEKSAFSKNYNIIFNFMGQCIMIKK
jgi:O-methyltransferase